MKNNVITIAGPNTFLAQAELCRLTADFEKKHGDLAVEKLDGEENSFDKLAEALKSLPFLASNKLVIIKNPSLNKQFTEQFEALIKSVPDSTDVILVETKPDKRTAFYKVLQKLTDFHEFKNMDARDLPNWLVAQAKARGGSLSFADATYLVQRVGANQQLLGNELDKLLLFKLDISRQTIDELTEPTPQSSIFELLDSAFTGNIKRMLELYEEQRAQKVEPQQIMAMLAWQLHVLAIVKTAGERSVDEIAREASLNPFVIRKSQAIAKKILYKDLKKLIHQAYLLDIKLKSQTIDTDDALQHFLLTIAE